MEEYDINDEKIAKCRITLHDVTQTVGVSLRTASSVINGFGRMTDETRTKTESAIKDPDYRVNVAAHNFNRDHTGFITLTAPSLIPPYLTEPADHTIEAIRQRDYSIYITTYAEDSTKDARDLLRKFNSTVSGDVTLSMSEVENISPDNLKVDFPLVIVGAHATQGIVDRATPDDASAAAIATSYLYDRGSIRFAVIGARNVYDKDTLLSAVEGNVWLRLRGIIEETRRRGLSLDPQLIGNTGQDWTIEVSTHVIQRLTDSGMLFDGVITLDDQLAIDVLTILCTASYKVSVQVQVISFDNNGEAPYLQIPLTTMDSRPDWAAPATVNHILGHTDNSIAESELFATESQVIVRVSTR